MSERHAETIMPVSHGCVFTPSHSVYNALPYFMMPSGCLRIGVTVSEAGRLVRHTSISLTTIYLHYSGTHASFLRELFFMPHCVCPVVSKRFLEQQRQLILILVCAFNTLLNFLTPLTLTFDLLTKYSLAGKVS